MCLYIFSIFIKQLYKIYISFSCFNNNPEMNALFISARACRFCYFVSISQTRERFIDENARYNFGKFNKANSKMEQCKRQ